MILLFYSGDGMKSRMDKYKVEDSNLKSRTELNKDLYSNEEIDDYNKIDLNSNISILNNDGKNIDVDQIREMLDKKYRDNLPKRKSITLEDTAEIPVQEKEFETRNYDINRILEKAKSEKKVDYLEDRLKSIRNTNSDILESLNINSKENKTRLEEEKELFTLIDTITELELRNKKEVDKENAELLDLEETEKIDVEKTNSFFTGQMKINKNDFEDFSDVEKDIKSNSALIKILVFIFIIAVLGVIIYFLNDYFEIF